jgi:glycosyltransferase involved in cell wall biosynthesis
MHFVGPDYRQVVNLPNIRWSPWSTNLVDYLRLLDFDIGLAPLAYHRFNKSKSDIKVLEYAALGIPVVASDFGPYAESVIHGETGFLVRRPHEWGRYLGMLAEDVALREQMSVNAKLWATSRTVQGNAGQWELAYRQTIARVHGEQRMLASAVSAVSA